MTPTKRTDDDTEGSARTPAVPDEAAPAIADHALVLAPPSGLPVREDQPRAKSTAEYAKDDDAYQRVVIAAGDPIPDGYSEVAKVDYAARAKNTPTVVHDDGRPNLHGD